MGRDREFTYDYARPAATADAVVFTLIGGKLSTLLIRRAADPFAGKWAIPGGFVNPGEPTDAAALRELEEETGVKATTCHPVASFGAAGRDPRGWTISSAYYVPISESASLAHAGDDAAAASWHRAGKLPPLAFDHTDILRAALRRFRLDLYSLPVAACWLSRSFDAKELAAAYAALDTAAGKLTPRSLASRLVANRVLVPALKSGHFRFAGARSI
jgi:8-oxo-dGTP diphosphatase